MQENVCQDVVEGYTTSSKCSNFPKEECTLTKKKVKKVTPETGCNKEPVELCAPKGCGFVNVSLVIFSFSFYAYSVCTAKRFNPAFNSAGVSNFTKLKWLTYKFFQGPVICTDRVKTIVVDKPVEECALEPVKTCSQVEFEYISYVDP